MIDTRILDSLPQLYTASPDTIKEYIDKHTASHIEFTDNIVSTLGQKDYYAQFKSLRSIFSDVKYTMNSSEELELPGETELRIENTQTYTIGKTEIVLDVVTSLYLKREQDGVMRCYKHVDVWKGKPAMFQFMRRGFGIFSSALVRAFIK